ncbi:MAG: serine/threonine-protein kinase, partial [Myxococcota bacterium]
MGSRDKGLPSGQIVAKRYRIERVVGQGGMGAVYHATQTDTGVPVALKLLLKHFSSSEVELKRFQREAALVQRIRHPNIVQLLDFGTTEKDQAFIAFELLDGQSLNQVLKEQGPIPSRWVASIARNLLEGLAAAHAQDVLHRDIKPGNVFLLRGSWKAKLLDFGVAKA